MGVERIKDDLFSEKLDSEKLMRGYGNVLADLLSQSFNKVRAGDIKVEDANDIIRLFSIFKQVTDYDEVMDNRDKAATGALPEVTTRQAKALGVTQELSDDGDIITEDRPIEELENEDLDALFNNLNTALNNDNVDKMGD